MNDHRQQRIADLLVFALLIAIGVTGRWGQPQWSFTPIAATAIFAGLYFSRWAVAAMVPLAILGISDLLLPAYNSVPVALATYGVMVAPVWFGRKLRSDRQFKIGRLAMFGLLPATLFYLTTNLAVWAFQSDYEKSLAGLAECYWNAVPFYRWMLAGDVFYIGLLFGCWALAGAFRPRIVAACAPIK
jgi:hypothetical protein